jgi:purine-binding chemotaxis protein CheW
MSEATQYLTFTLGGETYAVEILRVKEIIEYTSVTDVPMMAPSVRGVINLRGMVVTVIDLAVRFGRAPATIGKRTAIVILELADGDGSQVIGLLVDAVNAVVEIGAADMEPPPSFGTGISRDFIAGMGKVNGRFVIVLQAASVVAGLEGAVAALAE